MPMAKIQFDGMDTFVLSMKQVAELPDDVIDEMLNAGADVVVDAQRAEAEKLGKLGGYRNSGQKRDYSTGTTARSIKKGKIKLKNGQRVIYVTPTGTRKRGNTTTRNAEVAYENEYGTRTIQAALSARPTKTARTTPRPHSLWPIENSSNPKTCKGGHNYASVRSEKSPLGAVRGVKPRAGGRAAQLRHADEARRPHERRRNAQLLRGRSARG